MQELLRLTQPESVALVSVLVDRVASEHGIRALLIKGPTLEQQGLRSPRTSSDVDLLCEPSRVDEFVDLLRARDWQVFNEAPTTPQVLRAHAITLIHERWNCNLDLHHWFPGMYTRSEDAFEELWAQRSTVLVAAQRVTCTGPVGSAVVTGLHLLRSKELALTNKDLDDLVTAIHDQGLAIRVTELAVAVGAAETFAPILERIGPRPNDQHALSDADRRDWMLQAELAPMSLWLEELRTSAPHKWPGIVWRALTFDEASFWTPDGQRSAGRLQLPRLVFKRLRFALRALPGAILKNRRKRGDQ